MATAMELHRTCDVVPDGGLVCRQSRLAGVVYLVVFGGGPSAVAILIWWRDAPTLLWGPIAFVSALLVLFLVNDLRARLRSTNWLLCLDHRALWIHFRSYQDRSPGNSVAVLELRYNEIAQAVRHQQRYSTPTSKGGSIRQQLESLELCLHDPASDALAEALREARDRRQPESSWLGIRSRARLTHFAVSLPAADRIRIAWRGGRHHCATPPLQRVLDALAPHVPIVEPQRQDHADWRELADDQLDTKILELVDYGERMDAVRLLVSRRGYSLADASRFVDELTRRA